MPSERTSARLAPLAPSPRSETPCAVGLLVRLPLRRKSVKPGTWRSLSSSISAPELPRASAESVTAGAEESLAGSAVRVAVTVMVCETTAGDRVMLTSALESLSAFHLCSVEAKPLALADKVPARKGTSGNRKVPSAEVCALATNVPARSSTSASASAAPVASTTLPVTVTCPDAANNAALQQQNATTMSKRGMTVMVSRAGRCCPEFPLRDCSTLDTLNISDKMPPQIPAALDSTDADGHPSTAPGQRGRPGRGGSPAANPERRAPSRRARDGGAAGLVFRRIAQHHARGDESSLA